MTKRLLIPKMLVLAAALAATSATAQEKGSISGKVFDKKTGHALPFATVTVVGAQRGGLTDSQGQYLVTGVPVGTFEVRVQFLGYKPGSQPGVVVAPGKTTVVTFQLEDVVVHEEKAVEVSAERRLVEVKQGATIRSVTSQEIRNMPVQTIGEVLQQQAGINYEADQIHVRGGRADETIFVINGVGNRDLVTGQSSAGQLNARSVAEVNVATGAFDVRYGNALSGVVEVKLKEGGDRYEGGLSTTNGSYGTQSFQALAGGPWLDWGLRKMGIRVPGGLYSIIDVSGSLDETRFGVYTVGANEPFFGRFYDAPPRRRLTSSYEDQIFGHSFKYGDFFTPTQDNRWSLRYGMTWKPSNRDKWNFNFSKRIGIDQGFSRTLISVTNDDSPAFPWVWSHRIDHAPTFFEDNVQASLEWRRTLSTTGYTTFQLSRYFFAQRQDVMGKMWPEYEEPDDFGNYPLGDPRRDDYFLDSGDDYRWQDRRTRTTSATWSLLRRVKRHELEVGFEHQLQDVQYVTIENPWADDPDGLGEAHDLWEVHPWAGNVYLRDRLEYEGFTANAGLRADYWFPGAEAEAAIFDHSNPNITERTRSEFLDETHVLFGRRAKIYLSPRIIVAHPITENSSFFFNYGQFTQLPSYRYVYSKLTSVSSESFPLLGNPNLNPQRSVNYEVGGKHQFHPVAAINATFFQKDVYDYPTATVFNRSQGASLAPIFIYLNGHYARAKGFEVELEKRRSHSWSGKLTYTFEQTKGKSSDPNEQQVVESSGGDAAETPLSETFVRWNRPHKLAVHFDLRFEDRAPEGWGFLKNSGFNLFVQGLSGRAYTPINPYSTQVAEPNSKNGPFQITTDVRLNHAIHFGTRRLDFGLSGTNIFDNRLVQRVDRVTGKGRVWGEGEYDPALFGPQSEGRKVVLVDDPSNYGPGAVWRITLDYDF